MSNKITYQDAGVDVHRGYEAVSKMKEHVKSTFTDGVLTDIGSFGGSYSIAKYMGMEEPVLVSGTDGVGTKLKLAFDLNKHDTIGIDCVAMCVNDILCSGAIPLFFLDYIATGRISPEQVAEIVKGIATGCKESLCALVGGETAEMPGFYEDGEYDVAGFAVGIVDKAAFLIFLSLDFKSTPNTEPACPILPHIANAKIVSNPYKDKLLIIIGIASQ